MLPFKVNGSSGFTYLEKAIRHTELSACTGGDVPTRCRRRALAKARAMSDAGGAMSRAFRHQCRLCHLGRQRDGLGDNAGLDDRVREQGGQEWRKGRRENPCQ